MDDAATVKGLAANGLADLAAPLPGGAPAGPDLRQDFTPQSLYYRLRDARAEAREIERRVDHDPAADAALLGSRRYPAEATGVRPDGTAVWAYRRSPSGPGSSSILRSTRRAPSPSRQCSRPGSRA